MADTINYIKFVQNLERKIAMAKDDAHKKALMDIIECARNSRETINTRPRL
jgi:hypothetical protein